MDINKRLEKQDGAMDRYDTDWNPDSLGSDPDWENNSWERRRQKQKRRRRRNSRRARRERELRRKKRIAAAVTCAGVAAAVALAAILIRRGRSGRESSAALTASTEVEDITETASTEVADTTETASTEDSGTAEAMEAEPSQDHADAPYVFHETADTVQLGKSLTDISIYDAQRHIESDSPSDSSLSASSGDGEDDENSGMSGTDRLTDSEKEEAAKASDYVDSQYAILINTDTGEILAERNAFDRIVPASMTKVMTLLVAVEQMQNPEENLKDKVKITQEICDESYRSGSSFVGYSVDDEATVEDLLYGAILPSGADAAMALAEYTSGSQEAFVQLMNQKAEELGISDTTHFTNCVGLYDENHYSTVYDMSVIMRAAIDNELCKKILSTHTWTTVATKENPDGIQISNWFLRRIEDHDTNGTVLCGKTGFVNESGNCAVSYQEGNSGTGYIACTALTYNQWRCIYDHVALYKTYTK